MAKKNPFSTFISFISHPIFLPLIGILVITQFQWVSATKFHGQMLHQLLKIIVLTTVFIPIFAMGTLFQKYRPADFVELDRNERSYASWILSGVYLALLWLIPVLYQDRMIRVFFIAMSVSALIAGFANLKEKISLHGIGWSGLLVLMVFLDHQSFYDLFAHVIAIVLWIGVVGYARIEAGAHTRKQFYQGLLLGIIVNSIIFTAAYGI